MKRKMKDTFIARIVIDPCKKAVQKSTAFCMLAQGFTLWYDIGVVRRTCTAVLPAFVNTKEGGCMKDGDFLTVTGWVFSLLSLLIAVYMLGKGM